MVWVCCERNTRIMLILVLCLALWNLSNSAVIETVLLSKRSYSDKEGQRDPNLPTPSTFDLDRLTLKHKDRDDKPTPAYIDWNRFTFKPIDWDRFRFTIKPFDRFTYSPDSYNYNRGDDTSLKLAIFLPTAVAVVIVFLCKYFVCNDERNSNSEISRRTLHPPPRRVISPPNNVHVSSQNATRTQSAQSARRELFSTASNVNSSVTDSANRSNPTDKPPGYSDVVLADLSGQQNHFPEVKPAIPETPPPQYDDKNMRY